MENKDIKNIILKPNLNNKDDKKRLIDKVILEASLTRAYKDATELMKVIDHEYTSVDDAIDYVLNIHNQYSNSAGKRDKAKIEKALRKAYYDGRVKSVVIGAIDKIIDNNDLMIIRRSDSKNPNIYIFSYNDCFYHYINNMGRDNDIYEGNNMLYRLIQEEVGELENNSMKEMSNIFYTYVMTSRLISIKQVYGNEVNKLTPYTDVVRNDEDSPVYLVNYRDKKMSGDVNSIKEMNLLYGYPTLKPMTQNKSESLFKYIDEQSNDEGIENIKKYLCSMANSKMVDGKMDDKGKLFFERIAESITIRNSKFMWMISGKASSGKSFLFDKLMGVIYTNNADGVKTGNTKGNDTFGYLEQAACEGDIVYLDDVDKTKLQFNDLYTMLGKSALTYSIKYENEVTRERRANFIATLNSIPKIMTREGDVRFFNKSHIIGQEEQTLLPAGHKPHAFKSKFLSSDHAGGDSARQLTGGEVLEILQERCKVIQDINKDYQQPFGDIDDYEWEKIQATMLTDSAKQFFIDCIYNFKVKIVKEGITTPSKEELAYREFQRDMAEYMTHEHGYMPEWMQEIFDASANIEIIDNQSATQEVEQTNNNDIDINDVPY